MGPGPADMGQPTRFLPGRNWGVFSITAPADRAEQKLTWTIRANNQLAEVSFWANPPNLTEPFRNPGRGTADPPR